MRRKKTKKVKDLDNYFRMVIICIKKISQMMKVNEQLSPFIYRYVCIYMCSSMCVYTHFKIKIKNT